MRSITSVRLICDAAQKRGIPLEECLAGTGLTEQDLVKDDLKLTMPQEVAVIENYVKLAPSEVGLGVEIGQQMHVNVFGIWGFAILTSPTMRAAFNTAIDYVALSLVIAKLTFKETQEGGELSFGMSGLSERVMPFILERHTAVTLNFMREALPLPALEDLYLKTTLDNPEHIDKLSQVLGIHVKGGQSHHALVIPHSMLNQPLPKSDPVTLKFCLEQCDAIVAQGEDEEKQWTERVKEVVLEDIAEEKTLSAVADKLSMTERTLRRRLSDEGTTYRELYANTRLTIARQLLEASCLNVETVAWRVGYAEPASFIRAFVKQFGFSPGSLKKTC